MIDSVSAESDTGNNRSNGVRAVVEQQISRSPHRRSGLLVRDARQIDEISIRLAGGFVPAPFLPAAASVSVSTAGRRLQTPGAGSAAPVAGDPDPQAPRANYHVFASQPRDLARNRHLRDLQRYELVTPGTTNAKSSAGGLLDAEYCVQARQIASGTEDPEVRQTNTEESVHALYRRGPITLRRQAGFRCYTPRPKLTRERQ